MAPCIGILLWSFVAELVLADHAPVVALCTLPFGGSAGAGWPWQG